MKYDKIDNIILEHYSYGRGMLWILYSYCRSWRTTLWSSCLATEMRSYLEDIVADTCDKVEWREQICGSEEENDFWGKIVI